MPLCTALECGSARFEDPGRFPGNLAHSNVELAALGLLHIKVEAA